jgi:hypothetical protein
MSSPIYQNMINLVVHLSIRRCSSEVMDVTLWEHCTLTIRFLDMAKFTTLTPLSLLISCKLLFLTVGLKMSSLPALALKSLKQIFHMAFREFIEYMF